MKLLGILCSGKCREPRVILIHPSDYAIIPAAAGTLADLTGRCARGEFSRVVVIIVMIRDENEVAP
jgi:hypothetical protein